MPDKQPKIKSVGKLQFVPLGAEAKKKTTTLPAKRNFKAIGDLLVASGYKFPKAMAPYLFLNAAHTKVTDKGWLNAVNCRNFFADGPNIDFVPQDSFGGKIEVWMENVTQGDSFTVQFRVICGSAGNWKISSSETTQYQTPMGPVSQSIDFLIPPVTSNYGLVLISLEALFSSYGSWVFHDITINKISY